MVIAVTGVLATAITPEVVPVTGAPKNLEVTHVPAVLAVPAIGRYNTTFMVSPTLNSKLE